MGMWSVVACGRLDDGNPALADELTGRLKDLLGDKRFDVGVSSLAIDGRGRIAPHASGDDALAAACC